MCAERLSVTLGQAQDDAAAGPPHCPTMKKRCVHVHSGGWQPLPPAWPRPGAVDDERRDQLLNHTDGQRKVDARGPPLLARVASTWMNRE